MKVTDYRGGIMPPEIIAHVQAWRCATGMSEHELAARIGLRRVDLEAAEAGRLGLSPSVVERLVKLLGSRVE